MHPLWTQDFSSGARTKSSPGLLLALHSEAFTNSAERTITRRDRIGWGVVTPDPSDALQPLSVVRNRFPVTKDANTFSKRRHACHFSRNRERPLKFGDVLLNREKKRIIFENFRIQKLSNTLKMAENCWHGTCVIEWAMLVGTQGASCNERIQKYLGPDRLF